MDPSQQNYDFIMNPGHSPKQSLLNGASMKQRIIAVGILIVIVIILFSVGSSFLNSSANAGNDKIIDLAAYQSQLKSVIALGADKSRDSSLKNKAITAKYALESDYQTTANIIKKRGLKLPGDFATRYNTAALVQQLEAADKANNFDAEYSTMYTEKLGNYKTKLAEIYQGVAAPDQPTIKKFNENAKLLLGEYDAQTLEVGQ